MWIWMSLHKFSVKYFQTGQLNVLKQKGLGQWIGILQGFKVLMDWMISIIYVIIVDLNIVVFTLKLIKLINKNIKFVYK